MSSFILCDSWKQFDGYKPETSRNYKDTATSQNRSNPGSREPWFPELSRFHTWRKPAQKTNIVSRCSQTETWINALKNFSVLFCRVERSSDLFKEFFMQENAKTEVNKIKNLCRSVPVYFCCQSRSLCRPARCRCFLHFYHFSHPPTPYSGRYFIHCHARINYFRWNHWTWSKIHTNSIRAKHSHRQTDWTNTTNDALHSARSARRIEREWKTKETYSIRLGRERASR